MSSLVGAEVQGADRSPRTVSLNLRPQDSSIIEGMKLEETISIAVNGKITSMNISEYGVSLCLEIDGAGLSIRKPEPAKFIDQVEKVKVLKS